MNRLSLWIYLETFQFWEQGGGLRNDFSLIGLAHQELNPLKTSICLDQHLSLVPDYITKYSFRIWLLSFRKMVYTCLTCLLVIFHHMQILNWRYPYLVIINSPEMFYLKVDGSLMLKWKEKLIVMLAILFLGTFLLIKIVQYTVLEGF